MLKFCSKQTLLTWVQSMAEIVSVAQTAVNITGVNVKK